MLGMFYVFLSTPRMLLLTSYLSSYSNKADLAIINKIRAEIAPSLGRSSAATAALSQLSPVQRSQSTPGRKSSSQQLLLMSSLHHKSPSQRLELARLQQQEARRPRANLQRALNAVRFMVRMQIGARRWAKHEQVRARLAGAVEEMEREERIRRMRDQWRQQVQGGGGDSGSKDNRGGTGGGASGSGTGSGKGKTTNAISSRDKDKRRVVC